MAKGINFSTKRIQIDKANARIILVVSIAAFVTTFSLVASKSLFARQSYQRKVINAREEALDQLENNKKAVDDLKIKYNEFATRQENIIAGSSTGHGDRDGDNARIVLDALPSIYDFPGLASSLEKILSDNQYKITQITGTDTGGGQSNASTSSAIPPSATASPQQQTANGQSSAQPANTGAIEIPFGVGVEGSYQEISELLKLFNLSIRPLYIQSLKLTMSSDNKMQADITGKTYYMPERTLDIKEEIVP